MIRTLLHKTLLTAIAILLGGWAVVAEQHVVKGTSLSFKVEDNPTLNYRWEVKNLSAGTTVYLSSKTHMSSEYTFDLAGEYEVRVYPEDKVNLCLGEPLVMTVIVEGEAPTVAFGDLATPYVCSANNGANPRAVISCTVNYTGPLPWTFKYSVDSEPAILAEGAEEIWKKSFDFDITIRNTSGGKSRSEILIVEAQSISGIPVEENEDDHKVKIEVLGLPDTKFLDYEPEVMAGSLQSYTASILRHDPNITPDTPDEEKRYEIFVPNDATVLNENTTFSADESLSELTFDIQWGNTLGDQQVKLIEKNGFNCYGDTIYANINVVEYIDDFVIELGDDLEVCVNDEVILDPTPGKTPNYTFEWSTGAETQTIIVTESGTYSVAVNDAGNVKRDEITVVFHALPIVDLGEDLNIYSDESVTLNPGDAGDGAEYDWSTGEDTQTINVSEENIYSVEVTNKYKCSNTDEVSVIVNEGHKFTVDLGGEIEICEGDSAYLEPTLDRDIDATYKWIPGESSEKAIYVNKKGKYCVVVSDTYGNKESDCVDVLINPSPIVDLGDDVSLEAGESVELDAGNDGISYVWSTKETTSTIVVKSTGKYFVHVTDFKDCVGRDTVNIYSKGRRFLPSAFSPNGNLKNEVLYVRGKNIKTMTFIIYNRGGQKIFQSNRLDVGWDGKYKGELQRMDTYIYFLRVTMDDNTTETQRGEVTLIN